jgi:hypothetical protein
MLIKTSVLSLSLALFIGAAAAQAPSWPIVRGSFNALHLSIALPLLHSLGYRRDAYPR